MRGLSFVVAALAATKISAEESNEADNGYYVREPSYYPHDPYYGAPVYDAPRYVVEPSYVSEPHYYQEPRVHYVVDQPHYVESRPHYVEEPYVSYVQQPAQPRSVAAPVVKEEP